MFNKVNYQFGYEMWNILKIILPASPMGPPMMKFPHGLIWNLVWSSKYLLGMTVLKTILKLYQIFGP